MNQLSVVILNSMWEEEEKHEEKSTMVDVAFKIQCKTLPYEHISELSNAITKLVPWMLENNLGWSAYTTWARFWKWLGLDQKMMKFFYLNEQD